MACQTLRVDQIDSHILDSEISSTTHGSIDEVINLLPAHAARYLEKVRPEIRILFDALLWSHRFYKGASPGQELMDISYKEYTQRRVISHFSLTVLVPYLVRRIPELTSNARWSKAVAKAEAVFEAISLLHFVRFLRIGGHSTIVETVLSLRSWNNQLPTIGAINYDSQNRELMWHAFRDAILLAWPLANWARAQLDKRQKMNRRVVVASSMQSTVLECVICDKLAVIPVIGQSCGHISCYTCARQSGTGCPLCTEKCVKFARNI